MSRLTDVLMAVVRSTPAYTPLLNELDGVAGDGDMGVTVATGSRILQELLPTVEEQPDADVLRACGLALAKGAPSTIGTLVASGFLRAAKAAPELPADATPTAVLAELLAVATAGIEERGGAAHGAKTVLDALVPAVEVARDAVGSDTPLPTALRQVAEAADTGAQQTASMQAVHGRAGWLASRSFGHEDAGARLAAIVLEAAATATEELS